MEDQNRAGRVIFRRIIVSENTVERRFFGSKKEKEKDYMGDLDIDGNILNWDLYRV
jgi:hypothetical protein